jgi:hypothetical protein
MACVPQSTGILWLSVLKALVRFLKFFALVLFVNCNCVVLSVGLAAARTTSRQTDLEQPRIVPDERFCLPERSRAT